MIELLGTNNLSSVATESYRNTSNSDLFRLIFKKSLTFVLHLDATFMSYLSEMYNFLEELNVFMIACLVSEDEYIYGLLRNYMVLKQYK